MHAEHSTIIVRAGQVAIEGFLKMQGFNKVRLGTLQRRMTLLYPYATCMSVKFQTKCIIFAYIAPYLICSYLDMQNYAENMHQHRLYTDCTHK